MAPSFFKSVKKAITGTKTTKTGKDADDTMAVTSKDAARSRSDPIFSSPALDHTTDDNENAIASSSSFSSNGSFVRVPSSTAIAEQGKTTTQKRRDRRATAANRDVVNDLGYDNFNSLRKRRYGGGLGLDIYKKLKGGKQK